MNNFTLILVVHQTIPGMCSYLAGDAGTLLAGTGGNQWFWFQNQIIYFLKSLIQKAKFVDNKNKSFSGWPNWCISWNKNNGHSCWIEVGTLTPSLCFSAVIPFSKQNWSFCGSWRVRVVFADFSHTDTTTPGLSVQAAAAVKIPVRSPPELLFLLAKHIKSCTRCNFWSA